VLTKDRLVIKPQSQIKSFLSLVQISQEATDPLEKAVLDGRQLALKVCVYEFTLLGCSLLGDNDVKKHSGDGNIFLTHF